MSAKAERASRVKLAKLVAAFDEGLEEECIKEILEMEGDVNYAIPFNEQLELVNSKLQPGTVLHQVRRLRKSQILKMLKLLLEYGVDITKKNNKGHTVIHTEITQRTCDNNRDWANGFDHPIVEAILTMHVDHSIRANPCDDNGMTHFHVACMAKHTKAVKFFLDNGVDVDQAINRDSSIFPGYSPLHLAVHVRCQETAKKLLDRGANVCSRDSQELTPVQVLMKKNMEIVNSEVLEDPEKFVPEYKTNQRIIHLLLTSGRAVDSNGIQMITDEYGFSNLHAACTIDDTSLAESLLVHIEDVNRAINVDSPFCPGYTALHFAAHFNFDLVKLLLANCASLTAKDAKGLTPFDVCLQRHSIQDIGYVLQTNSVWRDIVLADNKTKLINLILAMKDKGAYLSFLDRTKYTNLLVDKDSPLWPGYTPLHLAVMLSERAQARIRGALGVNGDDTSQQNGWPDVSVIRECKSNRVSRGADLYMQDTHGATPLHLAFDLKRETTLRLLLDNARQMTNLVNDNNLSHLHIACAKGSYDAARSLVLKGASVSLTTRVPVKLGKASFARIAAGSTPLHMAVAAGHAQLARLLMQHGADLNATNGEGWTPLHCAMLLKSPEEMGRVLLAFTANLREKVVEGVGLSHLHVACRVDSLRGVKKLLGLGSDVNVAVKSEPTTDDHYCESRCNLLCKNSYAGFTPLHFALHRKNVRVVNVLLAAGADILARNAKSVSPLYKVLATNDRTIVNLFFDAFVLHLCVSEDLQEQLEAHSGITLLHIFVYQLNHEGVDELMAAGADANAFVNADAPIWAGCTALHMWVHGAKKRGYGECAKSTLQLLLSTGADVTLASATMDTPLHSFSRLQINDEETLSAGRLLLRSQKDFNVNPVNATAVSHFHIAVRLCDVGVAEEFLKRGVDVNQRVGDFSKSDDHFEKPGCSPLHLIAYPQSKYLERLPARIQTIDLLLKYGADVRARDVLGHTPLHALAKTVSSRCALMDKIVRGGGIVDVATISGDTPFASLLNSEGVLPGDVDFFLRKGCRMNVYNSVTRTGLLALPLCSQTISKRTANAVYKLLFKQPDIKIIDEHSRTAIHNIVSLMVKPQGTTTREIYELVIERLIKLGCDLDAKDRAGKTALHTAAQFKNERGVSALLLHGADVNLVDDEGKTAFDYALDACTCSEKEDQHYHKDLIKSIWIHVNKLRLLNLDVHERNDSLLIKAGQNHKFVFSFLSFFTQVNSTKRITILESDLLRLRDFLFETHAVAAYPRMPRSKIRAIGNFFSMDGRKKIKNYGEVRGLLALQYRKAVKRASLIQSAVDSVRILSGIQMPQFCCDCLLKYLSLYDVERLIASTST